MKNKEYKVYEVERKNRLGVAFVILGLLLAVSVCNIFGYLFFSNGINIVSGKENTNSGNFYAVEISCFDKYDEAYSFAQELQKKGGAGYITYNKKYKVLSSLYLTFNDAKKVAQNVQENYKDACVYELVLPDVSLPSDLNEKQTKALKNSLAVAKSNIATMTNIYLSLDRGDISEQTAKTMIHTLSEDFVDENNSIKTNFHSKDTAVYLKYQMYYNDILSATKQVSKIELKGSELSQMIKYQQIKLAFTYISMCNLFA